MKKVLGILSFLILIGCSSDDSVDPVENDPPYNFQMTVEVGEVGENEATISWNAPLTSEWGSVVYRVVVNNEVVADGLQNTTHTISDLDYNRGYNGTVFATGINGNETFAHFGFTTLPYSIYDDVLYISTQEEVDAFYYTSCIALIIDGSDITDLSPMSSLVHVSNFLIINNTSVTNLNGLQNLNSARTDGYEKQIEIKNNPNLTDVSALHDYFILAKKISISDNSTLDNLNGLEVQEEINLSIKNCPITSLPNFGTTSFHNLTLENLSIQDLSAFRFTPAIYSFSIIDMPLLTGFNGMDNIVDLLQLYISNNPLLTNLADLETLISSPGGNDTVIIISNNQSLTNFCGISQWMNNTDIWLECLNANCTDWHYYFYIGNNAYNPTEAQVESTTECSL